MHGIYIECFASSPAGRYISQRERGFSGLQIDTVDTRIGKRDENRPSEDKGRGKKLRRSRISQVGVEEREGCRHLIW